MSRNPEKTFKPMPLLALILAWLIPGAGHVYLRRYVRGVVIFVLVTATFWAGVAIGGVMTVDRHQERWWFIADMFTGVHGLVSWHRQNEVYEAIIPELPRTRNPQIQKAAINQALDERGLFLPAPTAAVARVYSGVAGMMALMCIFDAFMLAMMGVSGEPKTDKKSGSSSGEDKT